jgi:hypothetical protein
VQFHSPSIKIPGYLLGESLPIQRVSLAYGGLGLR